MDATADPALSRAPVVTGMGIVCAAGAGVDRVWDAVSRGASGLKPLTLFPSPRHGGSLVGEVAHDLAALGAPARGSRTDRLGWIAAREAVLSSGLDPARIPGRAGVVMGASVGGSFDSERFLEILLLEGKVRAGRTRFHEYGVTADAIADGFGLTGPCGAISTACSSGALAIAAAAELILAGEAEVMLAGGADSLSRMTWGGFHALMLVDPAGCRPFDARRSGMSLGEGAAVLVLEPESAALRRGATVLARLSGWGASCDAYHATAPHPDGLGAVQAMRAALRRAGLPPSAVDYVNAHGTGTRGNDLAEARALRTLFGERLPPVSSTKRFFGHPLGASGAIEAVVCIEALRHGILPPNLGFAEADPALAFAPVTEARPARLEHVLSNSFGFGGNNAVLLFSSPEATARPRPPLPSPVVVAGVGVFGPGAVTERPIEPPLPPGTVEVLGCGPVDGSGVRDRNQRRRATRLTLMAVAAAQRGNPSPLAGTRAVCVGTGYGSLTAAAPFIENLIANAERDMQPLQFAASVHNAPAAQVAMEWGARGMNAAPVAGEISFEWALRLALDQLAAGEADEVLAGAVDELNKYPLALGARWGFWTARTRPGEGAAMFRLVNDDQTAPPLARVAMLRLGRYRRPFDAAAEAAWAAGADDLAAVEAVVTGSGGHPALDPLYGALVEELAARAGRRLEHRTYREACGEYPAASAFGFSVAVDLVRRGCRGVLLCTLALRGGKAACLLRS